MNERDKTNLLKTLKQSKKVKKMLNADPTLDLNKKYLFVTEKEFNKLDSRLRGNDNRRKK